jgi:nicotinamidase-related amidase
MCVDAAVRAGHDFGFEILVVHDACATKALEFNGKKTSAQDVNTAMFAAFEFAYAKLTGTDDFIKNFTKLIENQ